MPRYQPKEVSYPLTTIEYHIVTAAGVTSWITNCLDLARKRILDSDPSFKLIAVKTMHHDITPRAPKSRAMIEIAKAHGHKVIDIPLAMSA